MEEGRGEREAILRRQLKVLPPEQFEVLVFELAAREDPTVRRLTAPDGGADTLQPATPERRAKVWQAKRYPDQINWDECVRSLDRAVEVWKPEAIVFAFTRDFSMQVVKSFQEKLVARPTADGVAITAWTLTDIVGRLDANPDIRVRFFGDNQRSLEDNMARMLAAGGQLKSTADMLERAKTLSQYAQEQDVSFAYQVNAGAAETPPPTWDELPYITMQLRTEQEQLTVAAWVREAAEVPGPTFSFSDDELGVQARAQALENWARGEDAVIADGYRVAFAKPQVIGELLEDEHLSLGGGHLIVPSPDGVEATLEVEYPGGVEERTFTVYPVPPRPGAVAAVAGYAGDVLVEVNLSLLERPSLSATFSLSSRFRPDARASADAAALIYAWCTHTHMAFRCELLGDGVAGKTEDIANSELCEEMKWRRDFYAEVLFLEERLGISLPLPEEMTHADLQAVGAAADALRTGFGIGQLTQVSGHVQDPLEIPSLPERFAKASPMRRLLSYTIFGREVNVGMADYDLPPLKIVEVIPYGQTPNAPARVVLEAEGDGEAPFRLVGHEPPAPPEPSDQGNGG
ncbi:MAG: hypothetical protein U0R70_17510 [Solirubrobacteraceae bacterium]